MCLTRVEVHWCSAGAWRCSRRTSSASPPGPAPLAGTTAGGESPPSLVTRAAPPPTRPTIPDELDPFLPPLPRPPNPLVSVSLSPALLSLALALLAWRRDKEKARSGLGLVCLAGFFLTRRGGGGYKNLRGGRGGGGARPRVIHARGLRRAVRRVRDGPPPSVGEEDSLTYLFGVVGT
jgi:hypothetical protein